jgi:hypothetical protein
MLKTAVDKKQGSIRIAGGVILIGFSAQDFLELSWF